MSVLGSGLAAGVAQTGLQAQQVARQTDKQHAARAQNAKRVREAFEAHLLSLEEGEEDATQLRVDDRTDEGAKRQAQREDPQAQAHPTEQAEQAEPAPDAPQAHQPPTPTKVDQTLYRHIDMQA